MTPADVLERAADVLDERGWCQGRLSDDDKRVCARGAIDLATCWFVEAVSAEDALQAHVGAVVTTWNDDASRTKTEVQAAMRECAAELRAAGGSS